MPLLLLKHALVTTWIFLSQVSLRSKPIIHKPKQGAGTELREGCPRLTRLDGRVRVRDRCGRYQNEGARGKLDHLFDFPEDKGPAKPRVEVAQGLDGAHPERAIECIPVFECGGNRPEIERCTGEDTFGKVSPEVGQAGPEFIEALFVVAISAGIPGCIRSWKRYISLCTKPGALRVRTAGEGGEALNVGVSEQPLDKLLVPLVGQVSGNGRALSVSNPDVDGGKVTAAVLPLFWFEVLAGALL